MEQDTHYMTREFLENKIVQLTDDIAVMTKFKEDLITNSNKTHDRLTKLQDELKSWTRNQLHDDSIKQEQAL